MAIAAGLRQTIARAKRNDMLFVALGVAALLFAACTFVAVSYTHLTLPTSDLV